MLHLEIRKIDPNGPYGAYRVDHNPGVPDEYSVLFDENDSWENLDFGKTPYHYSLIPKDKEKWLIRVGVQNDSGGNAAGVREVGVLFSQNDNILGIVIALFNAAPGQGYLSEFSTAVSNGLAESQLADVLAASSVFTGNILGNKTKDAIITELMSHFGLVADGVPNSTASIAEAYFNNRIDSNVGYGAIATEATYYLLSNTLLHNEVDKEFLPTSLLFKLKVVVADNYSANNPSSDLNTLQAVLTGITLRVGTDSSDRIEGGRFGGVIEGGLGGDVIILEVDQNARDILLLNNARDSQILNINNDRFISIRDINNTLSLDTVGKFSTSAADTADDIDASKLILGDDNNNSFFDVVTNFSGGAADTDDRIDVSSFNFTETQSVLLDVSARVSIDNTNLVRVPGLFHDDKIAGNRGLAFLKYVDEASRTPITYVFADSNSDGDFTAADDLFLVLLGVSDLINANFIYFPGDIGTLPADPIVIPPPPPKSIEFTLTLAEDFITGTSNDDLFTAPVDESDGVLNTLQSEDSLDGGAGLDTVTATLSNEIITPALSNIENIDARYVDFGVLDLSNAVSVQQITVQNSSFGGTVSNLSNVDILGVKNQNEGVRFSGITDEVQNLVLDTVGASQDISDQVSVDLGVDAVAVNITTKDANVNVQLNTPTASVETLNIDAFRGENRINISTQEGAVDLLTDITVTGEGSVDLTDSFFSAVQRVDGTANLGGISVDASASIFSTDFVGSPAADHFTSSTSGGIITAGGGQDTITLSDQPFVFPFFFDTLAYTAGDSILNADMTSHDIVNNFNILDRINLSAFGFTGQQASALADKGILTNSAVDGSTLFVPDFYSSDGVDRGVAIGINGNDSYVFVDANKDGDFNAASDLFIKLAGVGNVTLANFAF